MIDHFRQAYYRLKTFQCYLGKWGFKTGISIYFNIRKKSNELIRIYLPDIRQSVFVRPQTSDIYAFEHIFAHDCYNIEMKEDEVRWVVDCGANAGYSALYFANKYPCATIIAIEPDTTNVELIKKNTTHIDRVKILHTAVWKNDAFLKITNKGATKWAFTVSETTADDPESFKAIGLGEMINRFNLSGIDILKMDIEGAEYEVFESGYESWLNKTKVLIIELHERLKPGCEARFQNAINKMPHRKIHSGENEIVFFGT